MPTPLTQRILEKIQSATGWRFSESQEIEQSGETLEIKKSEPAYCPQAVSKLKAYKQQHQKLQNQFDEFLSQVPFLPDVKWDEPFMSSPHYKDITKASKDIFDNLYDAKEEARKKLEEFKEEIEYQVLKEKEFSTLTQEQKIDYLYSRCFKSTQDSKQKPQYQKPIPDFKNYELKFLYLAYSWELLVDSDRNKKVNAIRQHRNAKEDLARAYDCSLDQIITAPEYSNQREKALSQDIVYCHGSIFLDEFESPEGLELPQNLSGQLELGQLMSADGLKFPKHVGGDLWLTNLESVNNTTFPEYVGGSLSLRSLKSAKGLKLPKYVGRLILSNLVSAEGLELPEHVYSLDLSGLVSLDQLVLPKSFRVNTQICFSNQVNREEFLKRYPNFEKDYNLVLISKLL